MLRYQVEGMSCGHCVQAVTNAVKGVDPRAEVNVDLDAKTVTVQNSDRKAELAAAIADAGYAVTGSS